jgi:hypothetical protein
MTAFLDGRKVPQEIEVPLQLRGPDELKLIREIRKLALEKGPESAMARLREISAAASPSQSHHTWPVLWGLGSGNRTIGWRRR